MRNESIRTSDLFIPYLIAYLRVPSHYFYNSKTGGYRQKRIMNLDSTPQKHIKKAYKNKCNNLTEHVHY